MIKDILQIRTIRNDNRHFMTRDTGYISIPRQVWWYFTYFLPRYKRGLIKIRLSLLNDKVVGYVIRDVDWITIVVKKEYRGQGIGTILLSSIDLEGSKLEVLKTNVKAIKFYENNGFKKVMKNKTIIVMKYE